MVEGIDVSVWQKNRVDWPVVAASGVEFVFIKASEGTVTDPAFRQHWEGATAVGLKRGLYMFFRPDISIQRQVDTFIRIGDSVGWGDLRPAVDVEMSKSMPAPQPAYWLEVCNNLLEKVSRYVSTEVYLYTNGNALQSMFKWYTLKTRPNWGIYPLWVARYHPTKPPILPPGWDDWHIHQYDGGAEKWSKIQPGVKGMCDKNRWKGGPDGN